MKRLKRYRYPLIGLALLVLLLVAWSGLQFFSTSSRINEANFAKIKKGMTYEEILAILGKENWTLDDFTLGHEDMAVWSTWSDKPHLWVDNKTEIAIYFDNNHRAVGSQLWVTKRSLKERFAKYLP